MQVSWEERLDQELTFPVTKAQSRMWFLNHVQPDTSAYTLASGLLFKRPASAAKLSKALEIVHRANDVIRSYFEIVDGLPRAVVLPAESSLPSIKDYDLPSNADIAATANQRLKKASEHVFDLQTASPPIWFEILRDGPDAFGLIVCQHHIISDGWSIHLLIEQLSMAYEKGDDHEVSGGNRFYQFAQSEASSYPEEVRSRINALRDAPKLSLPFARLRPSRQRFLGSSLDEKLPAVVSDAERALCSNLRATPFVFYMSLVGAFLARLTGETDFVLGSPYANRSDPDVEKTIGLFVNSFGVRMRFGSSSNLKQVIQAVQEEVLDALDFAHVPLEHMVEQLNFERSLSYNPLFQIMVAYQSTMRLPPNFGNIETVYCPPVISASRFDLEWTFFPLEVGGGFRLTWNTDLFGTGSVERILSWFKFFATTWVENPELSVMEVPLEENPSDGPVLGRRDNGPDREVTVCDLFDRAVANHCSEKAITYRGLSYNYQELDRAATNLAREIINSGISQGSVVATLLPRSPSLVVAILAILKAGMIHLAIDPTQPSARWSHMWKDSMAQLLFTNPQLASSSKTTIDPTQIKILQNDELFAKSASESLPLSKIHPASFCYLIYTSGTTGTPKGVMVKHENLLNTLLATQRDFAFQKGDVFAVMAAVGFDIFYFELLSPLLVGGEAIIVDSSEWYEDNTLANIFARVTCFQAVPGMMRRILDVVTRAPPLSNIREVTTGGDRVPPSLLADIASAFPRARVTVTYGPTETAILASRFIYSGRVHGHPIGQPLDNVSIKVVGEDGRTVPQGLPGEIWIGGLGVAAGYHNLPIETSRSFIKESEGVYYATGDLGRWNENGILEFLGRRDHQVKIRGFRVEIGEIEAVIAQHKSVSQCVVLSESDGLGDAVLRAFVVPKELHELASPGESEIITEWESLFNFAHWEEGDLFVGWNSSVDGKPFSSEEMSGWLSATKATIQEALRRSLVTKPRMLEIGCGVGILISEFAPSAILYHATDFSSNVVRRARELCERLELPNVSIVQAGADTDLFPDKHYDVVILNSVIQYFPDIDYLKKVLAIALKKLSPGGTLVLGDVRSLHLLQDFYSYIARRRVLQSNKRVPGEVARMAINEYELILHPEFVVRVIRDLAPTAHIHISPKLMKCPSELGSFRFDVVVHLGTENPRVIPWNAAPENVMDALDEISSLVSIDPNTVIGWLRLKNACCLSNESTSILTPLGLVEEGRRKGLHVQLSWQSAYSDGSFDVAVSSLASPLPSIEWPVCAKPPAQLSNIPLARSQIEQLDTSIRLHIKERLPTYMQPATITFLDKLPLTENGKIDRANLPRTSVQIDHRTQPLSPIETSIAKLWSEVLKLPTLPAPNDNFFHLGGSSLSAIQLAAKLRQIGLSAKPQTLFENQTLDEIARAVVPSRAQPLASSLESPRILLPKKEPKVAPLSEAADVLLTGATGYLGFFILCELLRETSARITCVVRARDDQSAAHRLKETAEFYLPHSGLVLEEFGRRVRTIHADLSNGAATWDAFRSPERVDHVFHTAADVRHVGFAESIHQNNVSSTEAVVALARKNRAKLHHVSSIGIGGVWTHSTDAPTLNEREIFLGQQLTEAYSRSKIESELVVRDFLVSGGDASIYRASTVAPHSQSGTFQRNIGDHFLSRFVKAAIELGFALDRPQTLLSLVPVDVMSKWILKLASEPSNGRAFHLVNEHLVSYSDVVQWLVKIGYQIESLAFDEFEAAVGRSTRPDSEQYVGAILRQLERSPYPDVKLDSRWTQSLLKQRRSVEFAPSVEWFESFIKKAIRSGFLKRPLIHI